MWGERAVVERVKQNVIRGSNFEAAMFDEEGETAEKNDLTEGVNPAAASRRPSDWTKGSRNSAAEASSLIPGCRNSLFDSPF